MTASTGQNGTARGRRQDDAVHRLQTQLTIRSHFQAASVVAAALLAHFSLGQRPNNPRPPRVRDNAKKRCAEFLPLRDDKQ